MIINGGLKWWLETTTIQTRVELFDKRVEKDVSKLLSEGNRWKNTAAENEVDDILQCDQGRFIKIQSHIKIMKIWAMIIDHYGACFICEQTQFHGLAFRLKKFYAINLNYLIQICTLCSYFHFWNNFHSFSFLISSFHSIRSDLHWKQLHISQNWHLSSFFSLFISHLPSSKKLQIQSNW